ncbi:MAG: cupin domain-containing protein [Candidatus Eremiobacteraeota bacterium]|nr:cupin domain-containing protein [Candidatus Eremiobacteraeota bacterium]
MKNVQHVGGAFSVLETEGGVQTAAMRLERGIQSGPLGNEHADSVQVLFVAEGAVQAQIGTRRFRMEAGDSVIVAKGAAHRFVGDSDEPAITFNIYVPPAY